MKTLIRVSALVLALILLLGLLPVGAEAAPPIGAQTAAEQNSAVSRNGGADTSAESYMDVSETLRPYEPHAVMPLLAGGCSASQLALVWVNTLEPNPDGKPDSYIYFEFPKGVKRKTNTLILHTVMIAGRWCTAYCIEPGVKDATSYTSDRMTMDEWLASRLKTGNLTEAQMRAIGVVMLYGQIARPREGDYQGLANMMATQILVWEIAMGDRSPYPPYVRKNDTHIRRLVDGPKGVEISSYFLGIPDGTRITGITDCYNRIADRLAKHYKVPSFTSLRQSQAPVVDLVDAGDGTFTGSLRDTNGILDQFRFQDTDEIRFVKQGDTLRITARAGAQDALITCSKTVPSVKDQVYYVMYNGSYQQMAASAAEPTDDPLPAYLRVRIPKADLELVKTTDDGNALSGWRFGIYEDAACTKPLGEPQTTDSQGRIRFTGIPGKTVWVRELGHADPATEDKYECVGPNPRKVTLVRGEKNTVTFENRLRLRLGMLLLQKQTNTGADLDGWKIGLYEDPACSIPVQGSPFTTDLTGMIRIPDIQPGTYYAREIDESQEFPWWEFDTEVKKVMVGSDTTTRVTFRNIMVGDILVRKNAVNGSAAGWNFRILDAQDNLIETVSTGPDGVARSRKLRPGTYTVAEVHDRDETYWTCDAEVRKQVTVEAGATAAVSYTNTLYGRIEMHKTTNTGNHLAGWTFLLENDRHQQIGTYVTDSSGYACTGKLEPGRYYVKEAGTDDPYWACDADTHPVDVMAGLTSADTWRNLEQGRGVFHKQTNTGTDLEGWEITVYTDKECTRTAAVLTTDSAGSAEMLLYPGTYYAKETGDRYGRFDDRSWTVDTEVKTLEIRPHEDTPVIFHNVHCGRIGIIKTMPSGGSAAGWTFQITDGDGKAVPGSPFTTSDNGLILTGNLLPGTYTVKELIPEDSLYVCRGDNPRQVNVTEGRITRVSFENIPRPGRISVQKTDTENAPLAGAGFCLEWSRDGSTWTPVSCSENPDVTVGGCSAEVDGEGCLITGKDGLAVWDGLFPGLRYRVTEVQAPDGYNLLTEPAFEGSLPAENLTVTLKVVNTRIYELPKTGSSFISGLPVMLGLCAVIFAGAILYIRKKEV